MKKHNVFPWLYSIILIILTIYTYGFVDANFPYSPFPALVQIIRNYRPVSAIVYAGLILLLFSCYAWIVRKVRAKTYKMTDVVQLIKLTVVFLFLSFPAVSNDIFNYIATAKVAFLYGENPYIIMPIDIPNESMLTFLHASNKVALYGPVWILLTLIPHVMGAGNMLISIFAFKLLSIVFYLGLIWLIWMLSNQDVLPVSLFALHPLVVTETIVAGHNDVVMMFFALGSLYFLKSRRIVFSLLFLLLSVLIKYATVFLVPAYLVVVYRLWKHQTINWEKIMLWNAIAMFSIVLLSPIREELYPWYFIWPLPYMSLIARRQPFLLTISIALSFGLSLRFVPYVWTGMWGGAVPVIKKIVTIVPPVMAGIWYEVKKRI